MALTTVAKLGASGALIVGAILGPTLVSSSTSPVPVTHPVNVQNLLNWEVENGGCKVFMAVEHKYGKLYRPGGLRRRDITDDHINNLGNALREEASNSSYKSECGKREGKALMFYNTGDSWGIDGRGWRNKGGDVSLYLDWFPS